MPKADPLKPSYNAGELSPLLAARTDFAKYRNGCETLENMHSMGEGGAFRRPGSRYVWTVKDSTEAVRLKRFEFNTQQAYPLEFGAGYLRFGRNQGQITVADTDAAISNGTFPSGITDWDDRSTGGAGNAIAHDATNLRLSLTPNGTAADDIGWAEQDVTTTATNTEHVIKFRVIGAAGDKIEFQVGTASTGAQTIGPLERGVGYHCIAFTPTTSPFYVQFRNKGATQNKTVQIDDVSLIDNNPLEIDSPYAEADLFLVEGPQSADELYLFHSSYAPHKLRRFGHTTWSLEEVDFQDGPWLDMNTTATTMTPGATTGFGQTITASAITGINDNTGFQSTDVGRLIRIDNPASGIDWGYARITAVGSTTSITVDIRSAFGQASVADTRWMLGAWSATTGYPSDATFFQQRLWPVRTTDQTQTLFPSNTGDFELYSPDSENSSGAFDGTVEDDDSFVLTLSSDDVDPIQWISAGRDLVVGTLSGEWVVSSSGAAITPTDFTLKRHTKHGSAQVRPVRVGHVVLHLQRGKRKLREIGFDFNVDGLASFDMTRLAEHITYGGIVEMAYQQEPHSILWCVRNDGQLCCMTYRREEEVVGWSRMIMGGAYLGDIAQVLSVETIPGNNGSGQVQDSTDRDEVWVIVRRTINGSTVKYVEFFEREFMTGHEQPDSYYSDSCVSLDSPITITGATVASPVVVTAASHGFSNGDLVDIVNVQGMTELNGNRYKVANKTASTFELTDQTDDTNIDGTGFTAYATGGQVRKAVSSVSGLDHLEGATVNILADGAVHAQKTVSSGSVTLDISASRVTVGLPYTHTLKTLKMESGAALGTAVGQRKRFTGMTMVVLNAHTVQFGTTTSNLKTIDFRQVSDAMDEAAPLFTGERRVQMPAGFKRDERIIIQDSNPVSFGLLALAPEVHTNEGQ